MSTTKSVLGIVALFHLFIFCHSASSRANSISIAHDKYVLEDFVIPINVQPGDPKHNSDSLLAVANNAKAALDRNEKTLQKAASQLKTEKDKTRAAIAQATRTKDRNELALANATMRQLEAQEDTLNEEFVKQFVRSFQEDALRKMAGDRAKLATASDLSQFHPGNISSGYDKRDNGTYFQDANGNSYFTSNNKYAEGFQNGTAGTESHMKGLARYNPDSKEWEKWESGEKTAEGNWQHLFKGKNTSSLWNSGDGNLTQPSLRQNAERVLTGTASVTQSRKVPFSVERFNVGRGYIDILGEDTMVPNQ